MLKKILLIFITIFVLVPNTKAGITGYGSIDAACPDSRRGNSMPNPWVFTLQGSGCGVDAGGYVPVSGYYSAQTNFYANYSLVRTITTGSAYIDANKSLSEQLVLMPGADTGSYPFTLESGGEIAVCAALIGPDGTRYSFFMSGISECNNGFTPLPPGPPIPNTSCSINNGNALSVSLGTLNRDEIPTVPDSASAISKTISVVCTGGTVTAKMQLNYTPISVGSNQAVKTSANGVGAAIFYSNKVLAPADVTSVNFLEGSNTLTLGFQAVRDSTVALKDIPTGEFTANAVLVMTQQ